MAFDVFSAWWDYLEPLMNEDYEVVVDGEVWDMYEEGTPRYLFSEMVSEGDLPLRHLGSGKWADVYDLGGGRVVKVNENPCWDLFMEFAKDNPSPHLPRIVRHDDGSDYSITEMEILDELGIEDRMTIGFSGEPHDWMVEGYEDDYQRAFGDQWPGIRELVMDLVRFTGEQGCNLDLHLGNFMRAQDGTIVLNDPIA